MALRQHFIGSNHPLFNAPKQGAKGVYPYRSSIYYWWYEALRRSERYRLACASNGKGMKKLYADFGDVVQNDFRSWWTEKVYGSTRGAYLFAEPFALQKVTKLSKTNLTDFADGWNEEEVVIVAIPRQFTLSYIQKQVGNILNKAKKGERNRKSRALYPIARKFHIQSMRTAFEYYDLAESEPNLKRWELCNKLDLARRLSKEDLLTDWVWKEKQIMNRLAVRYLKQAETLIGGAEKGIFPAS